MSIRIGLITTLDTNIGDDFIREGISKVFKEVFKNKSVQFIPINKHKPFTVYPKWHPLSLAKSMVHLLPRGKTRIECFSAKVFSKLGFSYFDNCDLIVQCGTPVIWSGCSKCEWAEPLWHQVVGRLSRNGVPVLNLGAGSCYPWENQPNQVDSEKDIFYLKKILEYCRVTTVRDKLAQIFFGNFSHSCDLIPCPALLAGEPLAKHPTNDGFVVVNYMEYGGHYAWNQNIDSTKWKSTVRILVERISQHHKVLFLCHNQKEYKLVSEIDSSIPRFLPKNSREYFSVLSRAKVALCNRLHASVAMAGLGIPSLAVGTDTRLLMVEAIDLPYLYVKEASVQKIEEILQNLLFNRNREFERLLKLRGETLDKYIALVKKALCA